jgi:hypothetical protein
MDNYTHIGFINKNLSINEAIILNRISSYTRTNIENYVLNEIKFQLADLEFVLDNRNDALMFFISKSGEIYYHKVLGTIQKTLYREDTGAVVTLKVITQSTAPNRASNNITSLALPAYTFEIIGKRMSHWDFINKMHLDNPEDKVSAEDTHTKGIPLLQQDYKFKLFNILPDLNINFPITQIRFKKGSSPYKI